MYYMFDCEYRYTEDAYIRLYPVPELDGKQSWFSGRPYKKKKVKKPLVTTVKDHGDCDLIEFYSSQMVMHQDLVEELGKAGVDNIQSYDLVIKNEEYAEEFTDYMVVNIVGVVSVDRKNTRFDKSNPSRYLDASITSLAIDPDKANGLLMFRIQESITDIAIHESVKDHLEATGKFKNLRFVDPKDWESL